MASFLASHSCTNEYIAASENVKAKISFDFPPFTFHPINKASNVQVCDTTGDELKRCSWQPKINVHLGSNTITDSEINTKPVS